MQLAPLISWKDNGRRHLVVMFDKRKNKYVAGYSKYHPKLLFPKGNACEGDTPLEALSTLNDFLLKNGNSLPAKPVAI